MNSLSIVNTVNIFKLWLFENSQDAIIPARDL